MVRLVSRPLRNRPSCLGIESFDVTVIQVRFQSVFVVLPAALPQCFLVAEGKIQTMKLESPDEHSPIFALLTSQQILDVIV